MDAHLRDLRYFVAVAEELHFTRAAERLYVSQPALSKQIRRLERTLGAPLFARDARGVRLTDAGHALLPHAREAIASWDAGAAEVQDSVRAQRSTLTVGMSTSPGRDGLLPAVRSRFHEEHPGTQLILRQVDWGDPTAGLADESSDVAFVWLPLPDEERYAVTVLAEEPCLVALPAGHRLARRESIEIDDLLDEPFLALPESAGPLRDYWLAVEHRNGREPVIGAEIAGPDETYEALIDQRGICLLAAGNAPSLLRGGLVTRPVNGVSPAQLALAWRSDRSDPLVRAYATAAREAIGQPRTVTARDMPRGSPEMRQAPRRDPLRRSRPGRRGR
jgi:DNA-binding transcriptional LysR family regulator